MFRRLAVAVILLGIGVPAVAQAAGNAAAQQGGGRFDAQIKAAVDKELAGRKELKDVRATVEDQIVTLEGTVPLYRDKLRAYREVDGLDNVQGVRNLIKVDTEPIADQKLAQELADRLRYDRIDRGLMFNNFTIETKNGVVRLGGTARTEMDEQSALAIVGSTPGVTNVIDAVDVAPASPQDDRIRIQTARAIYGHPVLSRYANDPQAPIRIVVSRGHVTLAGVVGSKADAQIAETQARSVPGVFSVKSEIVVASTK